MSDLDTLATYLIAGLRKRKKYLQVVLISLQGDSNVASILNVPVKLGCNCGPLVHVSGMCSHTSHSVKSITSKTAGKAVVPVDENIQAKAKKY